MIRDGIGDCTLEPGRHLVQEELASMLGVAFAQSTVCRQLLRMGYRYKKRAWRQGSA